MKNLKWVLAAIVAISLLVFYACQKATTNNNQPLKVTVYLTDHQTPVFDSVFIDIQKLEVKLEGDTLSNGGWITLSIRPGVYNILRFRNGLDTLFGTGTLPNDRISKIRMTLGTQNSVIKDNQQFPLKVKDNNRQVVVNISPSNFEIVAPDQLMFWIDFDAGRSIEIDNSGPGNNNGYELKCHLKVFTHRYTGRIQGRVLPFAAAPIVTVISSRDTATAIPGTDGEYRIVGLNADTYILFIDGENGYRDTVINNIVVRAGEDTHVPTITLRQ